MKHWSMQNLDDQMIIKIKIKSNILFVEGFTLPFVSAKQNQKMALIIFCLILSRFEDAHRAL